MKWLETFFSGKRLQLFSDKMGFTNSLSLYILILAENEFSGLKVT